VILDVAAAQRRLRLDVLELAEQVARAALEGLHQHGEAAAVSHADHRLDGAQAAGVVEDLLQHRDEALGALEREALGAGELGVAEALEALGRDQLLEHGAPDRGRWRRRGGQPLHPPVEPLALAQRLDVRRLQADRAAIGRAQAIHDVAQGGARGAEQAAGGELAVQIGGGEAVVGRIQLARVACLAQPERIELRCLVAHAAVRVDERPDAVRLIRLGGVRGLGGRTGRDGRDGRSRRRCCAPGCRGRNFGRLGQLRDRLRGVAVEEELLPLRRDRTWIGLVSRIELVEQ
jgi:hypothetical protein